MNEERLRVLEMLESRQISAEEAADLLGALSEEAEEGEQGLVQAAVTPAANPPNYDWFRGLWRWPFAIGGIITLLLGLLLYSMIRSADGRVTLSLICTWPLFVGAVLVTMLALWSRWATWVHIRIREKDGRRIAISLPAPVGLGEIVLRTARPLAGEDAKEHLVMAGAFLKEVRRAPDREPLMIDVNDDDGDQVRIYIG